MKNLSIFIISFIILCSSHLSAVSTYDIQKSHIDHVAANMALSVAFKDVFGLNFLESLILTNIIGIAKETSDYNNGGRFDTMDLLANNIGCILIYKIEL